MRPFLIIAVLGASVMFAACGKRPTGLETPAPKPPAVAHSYPLFEPVPDEPKPKETDKKEN